MKPELILLVEVTIAIIIIALASTAIFRLNGLVSKINVRVSRDAYVNNHVKYQVALLLLSLIVLFFAYVQNPHNLMLLLSVGDISAPADSMQWFGIGENKTWIFAGIYLSVVITLGTLSFVYIQFRKSKICVGEILPYVGWILLFSLTNSFSEEAIFRLGVISPLLGELSESSLILLSAVIFGLVHFGGMPNGLIGMLMAGFLGWFLAKSVIDTHGIFWAWFIHFIQDVVIYIGFIVGNISAKTEINNVRGNIQGRNKED